MQQPLKKHDPHNVSVPQSSSGLPSVAIEITCGRARNRVRLVQRTTYFIGAGRDCDLVLSDPQFADVHAYLLLGSGGVTIRHLGQTPALIVDGRPVRRAILTDQSVIETGPFQFRVHIEPAAVPAPPASDVVQHVARLLDEVAQNKLPQPVGLQLHLVADDSDHNAEMATAIDAVSVGVPLPTDEPPPWQHMSWQQSSE
jgi:predicted component of type VI protein secretion system